MKSPPFALLALAFLFQLSEADWSCIGPEGGPLNDVVQSPSSPGTLYSSSGSYPVKVYRSEDGGYSWATAGSFNGYTYCMACGPTGSLYCGGSSYVYWSTNGGSTWSQSYQQNTVFYDIAAHPSDPQIVYGAGYRYSGSVWQMFFGRSINGGSTWTYTILETEQSYGYGLSVCSSDPSVVAVSGYVYSGSYSPRVYRSTDGGATFSNVTPAGASAEYYSYSVAIHPTDPDTMLFGTLYGVWRTTNAGASWTDCSSTTYNYSISYSSSNPSIVMAGGYNCIYRSTNGGQTWTTATSGLGGYTFNDVVPSAADQNKAYTCSTYGFFRSGDGGSSWVVDNDGIYAGKVLAYGVAASQPSTVYKQMTDMGVWKSTDYGSTWTHLTTPLSCGNFCGMAVNPTNPLWVLALEGSG